ncbi:hypothetical protein Tco_0360065 [Tanacetum coccineum]
MVVENDGVVSKSTKEKVKSLALKAKFTMGLDGKSLVLYCFGFDGNGGNKFGRGCGNGNKGVGSSREPRGCYNYGDKIHLISDCPKPKENKEFVGGAWSDTEDDDQPKKDATCLMVIESQKEYDDGNVVFRSNLKGKVFGRGHLCDDNGEVKFTKVDCTISKNSKTLAKGHRRNGLYTCKLGNNSNV